MSAPPILQVEGLEKVFGARRGLLSSRKGGFRAVSDVSFTLAAGERLGIVGESGSGKSTTARMLLRLVEPTGGTVRFEGQDLLALDAEALRRRRGGIQMVFQDPFSSLNPRLQIGRQIGEPLLVHALASGAAIGERVGELLELVGLDPGRANAYPHEFSGGQRQRIAIARALAANPRLLVADEAVSALDVSVRAQILNLLFELGRSANLALVFISHDLGVVRHLVDRIAVMYRGLIVEIGPSEALFASPRHPYSRALLSAMPQVRIRARRARTPVAAGQIVDERGSGCVYAARCPLVLERCRTKMPVLSPGAHAAACFRSDDVPPIDLAPPDSQGPAARRLKLLQEPFLLAASREGRQAS